MLEMAVGDPERVAVVDRAIRLTAEGLSGLASGGADVIAGESFMSTFIRAEDLAKLCVKAWTDYYIDEWCATAPDRYIPMAILPLWDGDASVAEAERVAEKGARTISFVASPFRSDSHQYFGSLGCLVAGVI